MKVYDIPVLFQVRGNNEDDAADNLAHDLEGTVPLHPDGEIESWHMPNHKHIDRSDAPVRVTITRED